MAARGFDAELAHLESLRGAEPAMTLAPLRKALGHRNNFLVSKAAKLVALHEHRALVPELVAAFTRFLPDGTKSDPQCWAKNALAQALSGFGYQQPDFFLTGMQCIQLEATWGGTTDSAGTLRGVCALGLVQCRELSNLQVLGHLLPLLADKELPVRVNAARAIEQVGTDAAALLLRLRAELGSDEPELLGACYSGVLRLEGAGAVAWAAKFLRNPNAGPRDLPDQAAAEAAFAIAETRSEEAAALLIATYKQVRDPNFRGTLLTALALTRQDVAIEFLFALVREGSTIAREALEKSAPAPAVLNMLRNL